MSNDAAVTSNQKSAVCLLCSQRKISNTFCVFLSPGVQGVPSVLSRPCCCHICSDCL